MFRICSILFCIDIPYMVQNFDKEIFDELIVGFTEGETLRYKGL